MSDQRYPSEKLDQYMLRLPDGMRDRIKHVAETNNRSMNAEIVATLEEKYPAPFDINELLLKLEMIAVELHKMPKDKEWARLSRLFVDQIDEIKESGIFDPLELLPDEKAPAPAAENKTDAPVRRSLPEKRTETTKSGRRLTLPTKKPSGS